MTIEEIKKLLEAESFNYGFNEINESGIKKTKILSEAINKNDTSILQLFMENLERYEVVKPEIKPSELLKAVLNEDISFSNKRTRINYKRIDPKEYPILEFLDNRLEEIVSEKIKTFSPAEKVIYKIKDYCFLERKFYFPIIEDIIEEDCSNSVLETLKNYSEFFRIKVDVKKKDKSYSQFTKILESYGEKYKNFFQDFSSNQIIKLVNLLPDLNYKVSENKVLILMKDVINKEDYVYHQTYGKYKSFNEIEDLGVKKIILNRYETDVYILAVQKTLDDPESFKSVNIERFNKEYELTKKIYTSYVEALVDQIKAVKGIETILYGEQVQDERLSDFSALGNDQLSRNLINYLQSSPKHKKSIDEYQKRGLLKIEDKTYQKNNESNEEKTKKISFINPHKDGSFNITLFDPEKEEELNYIVDNINKMVLGGQGLKFILACIVLCNKNNSRSVRDISVNYIFKKVFGRHVNQKILEEFSNTIQLFQCGYFDIPVYEKGKNQIRRISPIMFPDRVYDIESSSGNTNSPVKVSELKKVKLSSFSIELHEDIWEAMKSNQFLLFDESVLRIDTHEYRLAIQIYLYAMQRFRLPNKLQEIFRKVSVRKLFEKYNYPTDLTDVNISRNYNFIKKNILHLVELNLLGKETSINENDKGSFEDLLNRVWILYPSDDSSKDFNKIREAREKHVKQSERTFYSPEEVRRIWKDSGLSLRDFSEQTGINLSVLSKYFNRKTRKLSDKVIIKLKEYKSKREGNE